MNPGKDKIGARTTLTWIIKRRNCWEMEDGESRNSNTY
jgi:hypothetical protein